MAKEMIERDKRAGKLLERASVAEDTLRATAEMMAEFVMEAEVSSGATRHRGRIGGPDRLVVRETRREGEAVPWAARKC